VQVALVERKIDLGESYCSSGERVSAIFLLARRIENAYSYVQSERGEAKFWLEPQIELAQSYGLPQADVNEALRLIRENEDVIRRSWNEHIGR
jgi:hypothetical protein